MIDALVVIAKRPVAGRVKTRLVPPLDYDQAAEVARAALEATLHVVEATRSRSRILAFDGDPAGWLRPGWRLTRQPPGGLDVRLCAAFAAVGSRSAVLVGMDTPQLRSEQLEAFDPRRYDACLGPAADGGYWAVGFRDARWAPATIQGVAMSTETTGDEQLGRLRSLGLRVQILDELVDVDTADSALTVAAAVPDTPFSDLVHRLLSPAGTPT